MSNEKQEKFSAFLAKLKAAINHEETPEELAERKEAQRRKREEHERQLEEEAADRVFSLTRSKFFCEMLGYPENATREEILAIMREKKRREAEEKEQAEARELAENRAWLREMDRRPPPTPLNELPYAEYLQTPHWHLKRKEALKRAYYRCQLCGAGNLELHVHHTTYERLGDEHPADLTVLCHRCHKGYHERNGRHKRGGAE